LLPTGGAFGGASLGIKQLLTGDINIIPLPGLAASAVHDNFDEEPEVIYGNGDGIVPLASLESGRIMWRDNNHGTTFSERVYKIKSHLSLLKYQRYI